MSSRQSSRKSSRAQSRTPADALRPRLGELMLADAHRLRKRIDGVRKITDPAASQAVAEEISGDIDAAEERVRRRRAAVPKVTYPEQLPVAQRVEDLAAAIRDNQVVIVAGETGSGKTTQLPKICLDLGRGVLGTVGHTQPRRLAARTVGERVAEELDTPLGGAVGYKVRFTAQTGDDTQVKLMTDGILLAEIQHDRMLRQYDTLIIDEAHERSLNIDFILGYLKRLLPQRPDLKVIITSATIDPERFARQFGTVRPSDDAGGGGEHTIEAAPIVEVSGRTYPVEVRYRPVVDPDDPQSDPDRDQLTAVCDAVRELSAEGPGDLLVFLSGEREIRDVHAALEAMELPRTEVLPLYARLSAGEQQRVFTAHTGRRIVLATNVAETSLTVPGIKYVIDPGTARISRYSFRTKVQRLPIERISQASANQRKGRCGRTSDGICIRLYSQADFESRQEFTDPEILRTNLASVILQMASLGLGDIAGFPFVDPPDRRQITAGNQLLTELGAFDSSGKNRGLTDVGKKLAQLPVDPRMGRMVLEADSNGCVREVMIIAAALSIQDPRERPAEKREAADARHARFDDQTSDFLAYLNLWEHVRGKQRELSNNQFRKLCRNEYLSYLRLREWQDIYSQLRQLAKPVGIHLAGNQERADSQRIHTSLAAGLLSHVGLKDAEKGDYLGARGTHFAIFPGSALFKKQPRFVISAELVETSRLWGRVNARVEPEWLEPLAKHLVKRNYSEPHWERKQGAVMAYERVTLYGVPLVAGRRVNYGRVDPELARELFIRHALVEGDWDTRHQFFHDNRALLADVEDMESRARRRDILVDDDTLFDFYDARIGSEVVSAKHFDTWWKKARRDNPDLLTFEKSMVVTDAAEQVSETDYPDAVAHDGHDFPLTYQFEPGSAVDGLTVHIPVVVLNQVDSTGFEWLVPGMREELVTGLIKSLPKRLRRNFAPAPDHARRVLERIDPSDGPLLEVLSDELEAMTGVALDPDEWHPEALPEHLRITFRVHDENGTVLAEGRDLDALREQLSGRVQQTISTAASDIERVGLREPDFGELPTVFTAQRGEHEVRAYPALVDEGDSVAVRTLDTPEQQRQAMWRGTGRLIRLNLPSPTKFVNRGLSKTAKLVLNQNPHGGLDELFDDCVAAAVDSLLREHGGPVWDEASFRTLLDTLRPELNPRALGVVRDVEPVLRIANQLRTRLAGGEFAAFGESVADVERQLGNLVYPGFVTASDAARLPDIARYLRGIEWRLDKLPEAPGRDVELSSEIAELWREYTAASGYADPDALGEVPWMLEELRVSYFAQQLGTAYPVSAKRIRRAIAAA